MSEGTCPECGRHFKGLGHHWRHEPSHRPSFTDEQHQILTGLVLGDGTVDFHHKNARVMVKMISRNYLRYVDRMFGVLGSSIRLNSTAEEAAEMCRKSGFAENPQVGNYSDVYIWGTRCHPEIQEFVDWYETGEKAFPEDIELTPTVLRHWYVGDGHYLQNDSDHIFITMCNEVDRTDNVECMFERADLPTPCNWSIRPQQKGGGMACAAYWSKKGTVDLFEYMGHSLPDFGYKFPDWCNEPDTNVWEAPAI